MPSHIMKTLGSHKGSIWEYFLPRQERTGQIIMVPTSSHICVCTHGDTQTHTHTLSPLFFLFPFPCCCPSCVAEKVGSYFRIGGKGMQLWMDLRKVIKTQLLAQNKEIENVYKFTFQEVWIITSTGIQHTCHNTSVIYLKMWF